MDSVAWPPPLFPKTETQSSPGPFVDALEYTGSFGNRVITKPTSKVLVQFCETTMPRDALLALGEFSDLVPQAALRLLRNDNFLPVEAKSKEATTVDPVDLALTLVNLEFEFGR